MVRDQDFGIVRVRAFGTYDFKIVQPARFLKEVAGTDHHFRLDEFADVMRSRLVSVFSEALAEARVPVLDVATRYSELGDALLPLINPILIGKYGIEMSTFVIENVSVPPEVEAAIDKRSSMGAVGNLNDYVKFQMGHAMGEGGEAGAAAAMPAQMAVGFAMAQEMARGMRNDAAPAAAPVPAAAVPALEVLTPEQAAQTLGVSVEDVMAAIASGDLKARQIGTAHRIAKSSLEAFLRGE
jgi:excisionase family DNA binding protein